MLNPHENVVLRNLHILTKLLDPEKLADRLDFFFVSYPGALELFCKMLSEEDGKEFLIRLCKEEAKRINSELVDHEGMRRAIEAKEVEMKNVKMPSHINFLFVLLRQCAQTIPNDVEYMSLKVHMRIYTASINVRIMEIQRRVRFDEEEKIWVLEDWQERDQNRPDWKEIARG